jgi:4-hydroxythreonine-4-phosphate dehydrogenase
MGEPCGIGPELVVRSLPNCARNGNSFRIYGSESILRRTAEELGIEPFWSTDSRAQFQLVPPGLEPAGGRFSLGDKIGRARATLGFLEIAAGDIQRGEIGALVTAPIDKAVVRSVIPSFTGHTAYLGDRAHCKKTFMLLDNTEIRIVLLTEHIPLRDVAKTITHELIEEALSIACDSFRRLAGKEKLRVAVLGLNPHAGEIVERSEEEMVLKPVIERMTSPVLKLEGPFPADSFISQARKGGWDFILSPYHDQGLIAAKYLGLDKVVNITLGLPYLRVSPGHGTAYDIVGHGKADIRSFQRAVEIAMEGSLHDQIRD